MLHHFLCPDFTHKQLRRLTGCRLPVALLRVGNRQPQVKPRLERLRGSDDAGSLEL